MKSSYKIFQIFGISINLHISFILFLLFLFLVYWLDGGLQAGIAILCLFALIFTIVLLHELTHSLVAIKNGITVPSITLLPIGGLAHVEILENPEKELAIAIAGPLLNFCLAFLAGIIFIFLVPNPTGVFLTAVDNMGGDLTQVVFNLPGILSLLIWINLMLGFFNILPGFPMDGGRVFRAVLALWMDYVKATQIAVRVGQVIFLGMIFFGLFFNFWLVIIGIFLFFASGSELSMARVRHSLHDLRVGSIVQRKFRHVSEEMTLEKFLKAIARPDSEYYLAVNSDGKVTGILSLNDIVTLPLSALAQTKISEVRQSNFQVISADEKVEEKLPLLLSQPFLLVISQEKQVIGYLTPEYVMNVARFYGIKQR